MFTFFYYKPGFLFLFLLSFFSSHFHVPELGNCLGKIDKNTKVMIWQNYEYVWRSIQAFGNGLKGLLTTDDHPESDVGTKVTCIGIYSINRPEYVISEYGSYWQSYTVVPIYDTLGPNALSFIVNQGKNILFFHLFSLKNNAQSIGKQNKKYSRVHRLSLLKVPQQKKVRNFWNSPKRKITYCTTQTKMPR